MSSSIQLGDVALEKVRLLSEALGLVGAHREQLDAALALLGAGWFEEPLLEVAPFPNDLTDDATPFELSVAFSRGGVELRALAEPQRAPYSGASNWQGGLEVHAELRRQGLDFSRFDAIAWLFEPVPGKTPRFGI